MRVVLFTQVTSVPTVRDIIDQIRLPEQEEGTPSLVVAEWDESHDQKFGEGEVFNFYIPFTSTRGLQVWLADMQLHVTFLTFSDDLELDLALQIMEACKAFGATIVWCDVDEEGVGFDFLRKKFCAEFNNLYCRSSMRSMMDAVEIRGMLVQVEGPLQSFHYGKHLNQFLAGYENETARVDALRFMMRMSQYWSMMPEFADVVMPEYEEVGDDKVVAVIQADTPYLVSAATHFRLRTSEGDVDLELSRDQVFERFRKFSIEKFYPLDEVTMYLNLTANDMRKQTRTFARLVSFIPSLIGA